MKTVWILGDQLLTEHAALGRTQPGESRVLMIESKARGSTLPYHQLKLVLVVQRDAALRGGAAREWLGSRLPADQRDAGV